jgi:hypothetical protein
MCDVPPYGHPIGTARAILIGTLVVELGRRNLKRGMGLCVLRAAWRRPLLSNASSRRCGPVSRANTGVSSERFG